MTTPRDAPTPPDPTSGEHDRFLAAARRTLDALVAYRERSLRSEEPVLRLRRMREIARDLRLTERVRDGGLLDGDYDEFLSSYLADTTRFHHPGYLAHQVAVPHPVATLAAMVDAFTNNAMAVYEVGPAASTIEFFVVNWMLGKIGWRPAPWSDGGKGDAEDGGDLAGSHGGGVLTHGGSLANLTALSAARQHMAPDVWREGVVDRLAVLASPHAHYSVARSWSILGMGSRGVIPVATRDDGTTDASDLPAAFLRAERSGYRVICVAANACSTPTGRYDRLDQLGAFCRERKLWFHVDGAHGASALLSPRLRPLLAGIELADSVVWDAHKMLQTPALCAGVLVRDSLHLDSAFHQDASYLIHEKQQPGFDSLQRTVECTKAGLGLKFYTVLATLGERRLAEFVEGRTDRTREAWHLISRRPGFDCPVEPESNILCFRYGDDDDEQLRIRDRLIATGRYYLSSTSYRGKRFLRIVVMHPRTDGALIERLLDDIEAAARS